MKTNIAIGVAVGIVLGYFLSNIRITGGSIQAADTKIPGTFSDPAKQKECEEKWIRSAATKRFASAAAMEANKTQYVADCMKT